MYQGEIWNGNSFSDLQASDSSRNWEYDSDTYNFLNSFFKWTVSSFLTLFRAQNRFYITCLNQ